MRFIDADLLNTVLNSTNIRWSDLWKRVVLDIIDNQQTVEPNQWIPCSERLPDDIDENLIECYLVTDGFLIWMAYYKSNIGWVFAECTNSDKIIDWTEITAWQPLPQPYKPN